MAGDAGTRVEDERTAREQGNEKNENEGEEERRAREDERRNTGFVVAAVTGGGLGNQLQVLEAKRSQGVARVLLGCC